MSTQKIRISEFEQKLLFRTVGAFGLIFTGLLGSAVVNQIMIGDGYENRCDEIRADFASLAQEFSKIEWPKNYSKHSAVIRVPMNAIDVGGIIHVQNKSCPVFLKP